METNTSTTAGNVAIATTVKSKATFFALCLQLMFIGSYVIIFLAMAIKIFMLTSASVGYSEYSNSSWESYEAMKVKQDLRSVKFIGGFVAFGLLLATLLNQEFIIAFEHGVLEQTPKIRIPESRKWLSFDLGVFLATCILFYSINIYAMIDLLKADQYQPCLFYFSFIGFFIFIYALRVIRVFCKVRSDGNYQLPEPVEEAL